MAAGKNADKRRGLPWPMLVLAAIYMVISACATMPQDAAVRELPAPGAVVQRLEARRQSVRSFTMAGSIWAETGDGGLSGDHLIHGVYPARLRAEVMGPFGRPVLLLIADGARLTVLDYRDNRAYAGPANRDNLARFLGLRLSVSEVYSLLTGNLPLMPHEGARVAPAPKQGAAMLELVGPGGAVGQDITFSLGDFSVLAGWLRQFGRQGVFSAQFSDLVKRGPGRFPLHIKLTDDDNRQVLLDNDQLTINKPVDGALFEPNLPPGVVVRALP